MSPIPVIVRCRLLLGALAVTAYAVVNAAPPAQAGAPAPATAPATAMQPVPPEAAAGAAMMAPPMEAGIEIRRDPTGDAVEVTKPAAHPARQGVKMAPVKTGH